MNNEPVAWMEADVLPLTHIIKAVVRREQDEQHTIPLYTHPVKELTDEETIKKLKAEISSLKRKVNHEYIRAELALANNKLTDKEITEIYFDDPDILVFARAILRKAQEK